MTPDEEDRRRINIIRYCFLAAITLNMVQANHRAHLIDQTNASKQSLVQEAKAQPEGAIALEQRLYNQYRPLVFGDLERGIKPLADLNGDGRVDEEEKANIYRIAGIQEEQILRFGKETFYPVLTGYQMQGVWQKLSDMNVDKIIKQTKQPR